MGPGRPYLLTVNYPLIPVAFSARSQGSQVRSRTWLGEELAPDFFISDYRRKEPPPLILGPVGKERRSGQIQSEWVESPKVEWSQLIFHTTSDIR
jgi:hypothetical protein